MPGIPTPVDFSVAECLRQHPYFKAFDPPSLEALAAGALRRTCATGAILFLDGEPSAGLWIVEHGRAKVFKLHVEGREHILHLPGPGDSFNDISALDGGPNPASASALSPLTAWVIPSERLAAALDDDPALAHAVIAGLSQRVRALVQQIEDLALYSAQARLARFLLAQSEDSAMRGPGITRATIAAHLGTTPETVSRMLRTLEEAGAIRFDRHRIVVVDLGPLRNIALM